MKIPKQAKRVFKGVIFDIYHWQQKMYDGSLATFEMIKRPGAVRIIAVQGDKILLSEEKQPGIKRSLGTFGGRMDIEGETPLGCAKRELLEEAGLESKDWELLNTSELYPEKMDFTIYLYVARNCQKTKKPNLDRGEKIKTVPVSFEKFIKIILDKKSPSNKSFALKVAQMVIDKKLGEFKKKLFNNKKSR